MLLCHFQTICVRFGAGACVSAVVLGLAGGLTVPKNDALIFFEMLFLNFPPLLLVIRRATMLHFSPLLGFTFINTC